MKPSFHKKWKCFCKILTNKVELFSLFTEKVKDFQFPENKQVNITSGENVFSRSGSSDVQRCDHEKADTKIAVHVLHAFNKGDNQVLTRTADTDIVVIMIGLFNELLSLHPSTNVWISLGMGKHSQLISVKAICTSLGPDTSRAMSLFHSLAPLLVVRPPLGSRATERDQLGKLGSRIVRLQIRSSILLITHITTWIRRTPTLSCLSGLLWFSMRRQVMETSLMKQEKK